MNSATLYIALCPRLECGEYTQSTGPVVTCQSCGKVYKVIFDLAKSKTTGD